MAGAQRTRAYVWLALASALLVLLASGVAISRLGGNDHGGRLASAPETASAPATGAGSGAGSALGGGAGSGPAPSSPAESAAAADMTNPDGSAQGAGHTTTSPVRAPRTVPAATPRSAATASGGSGRTADAGYGRAGAGSAPQGSGTAGGGPQGGAEASPPGPQQPPPEEMSLVGASVSAGQGDSGGVVGAGVDSTSPDADVTVGTNRVVGDQPPSQGTGVGLHGRFFHPPPSIPVLPG